MAVLPSPSSFLSLRGAALGSLLARRPGRSRPRGPSGRGRGCAPPFRNERPDLNIASELIREAVAATRWRWPEVPALGMVTFIDETKVRPTMVRGVPVYGWTFRAAGFVEVGRTKEKNLLALQLHPTAMPMPAPARGASLRLFDEAPLLSAAPGSLA